MPTLALIPADRSQFEEFVATFKRQLKAGGSLATAATSVGASLGWLNPLSWFGSGDDEQEKRSQKSDSSSPPRALSPGRYYSATPSVTDMSVEPTHRMKATQGLHQEANRMLGNETRSSNAAWQSFHKAQQEHFLSRQGQRIQESHQQAVSSSCPFTAISLSPPRDRIRCGNVSDHESVIAVRSDRRITPLNRSRKRNATWDAK